LVNADSSVNVGNSPFATWDAAVLSLAPNAEAVDCGWLSLFPPPKKDLNDDDVALPLPPLLLLAPPPPLELDGAPMPRIASFMVASACDGDACAVAGRRRGDRRTSEVPQTSFF
jgi:hypothetical protein